MGKIFAIISFILVFTLTKYQVEKTGRAPASEESLKYYTTQEIDEKLNQLYVYQMIDLKSIKRPFSTERTLAKKQLTNEIYKELIDRAKPEELRQKVRIFAQQSPFKSIAVTGLLKRYKYSQPYFDVSKKDIMNELRSTVNTQEFSVLEQNIEHLSHLIKIKAGKSLNASSEPSSTICEYKSKEQTICNL